jgi:hypothetical protein
LQTQKRESAPIKVVATTQSPEGQVPVATFHLTLSVKAAA